MGRHTVARSGFTMPPGTDSAGLSTDLTGFQESSLVGHTQRRQSLRFRPGRASLSGPSGAVDVAWRASPAHHGFIRSCRGLQRASRTAVWSPPAGVEDPAPGRSSDQRVLPAIGGGSIRGVGAALAGDGADPIGELGGDLPVLGRSGRAGVVSQAAVSTARNPRTEFSATV